MALRRRGGRSGRERRRSSDTTHADAWGDVQAMWRGFILEVPTIVIAEQEFLELLVSNSSVARMARMTKAGASWSHAMWRGVRPSTPTEVASEGWWWRRWSVWGQSYDCTKVNRSGSAK